MCGMGSDPGMWVRFYDFGVGRMPEFLEELSPNAPGRDPVPLTTPA